MMFLIISLASLESVIINSSQVASLLPPRPLRFPFNLPIFGDYSRSGWVFRGSSKEEPWRLLMWEFLQAGCLSCHTANSVKILIITMENLFRETQSPAAFIPSSHQTDLSAIHLGPDGMTLSCPDVHLICINELNCLFKFTDSVYCQL